MRQNGAVGARDLAVNPRTSSARPRAAKYGKADSQDTVSMLTAQAMAAVVDSTSAIKAFFDLLGYQV